MNIQGKIEEDVKPEDVDGFDGRGVFGWNTWVCGLGVVSNSLAFGLVRGTGAFAVVLPSFPLVSRMPFAHDNRGFGHFSSAVSSSRRETMVGGVMTRTLLLHVGLGVGGAVVASGSGALPA